MNLLTIFLTGLLTGGLTCLAVQGGLLASVFAQNELKQQNRILPLLFFLVSKLISYTLFGLLLGWFGSFFKLSLAVQITMQILIGTFMIGTALNLLNVHPFFRYFIIQPPRFLLRLIRKQTKNQHLFAPVILGAFTVFIPCGTTQAMMALAIASASPVLGATILFIFILGTSPVFYILGYLATKLEEVFTGKFTKVVAISIIILALFNINSALVLTGWTNNKTKGVSAPPQSQATLNIEANQYNPNYLTASKGTDFTLTVTNKNGYGCIQAFTIPKLGIQKVIPPGTSETFKLKLPNTPGDLAFMCSMGMYRGIIHII